jgi:ribulose-5-phosphate 4-epimerase/fuculose-1-phosphate aldolase
LIFEYHRFFFYLAISKLTNVKSRPANAAGFLIHSEIHKARPDVHAVCHAHTIAGRAWSAFARPLDMINQDICNFYNALAVYSSYGGIVLAQKEGKNIAKALGKTNKVCFGLVCQDPLHGSNFFPILGRDSNESWTFDGG